MNRAVWIALSVIMLVGCSRDLTGTAYVKTKGGDVKRVAGVEVYLVTNPGFEKAWLDAEAAYRAAYAEARVGYDEAERQGKALSEEHDQAFKRRMARGDYSDRVFDRERSDSDEMHARVRAAIEPMTKVSDAYKDHAAKLVEWGKSATTRTNVEGRFTFSGVPRRRVFLFAMHLHEGGEYPTRLVWLVPVEPGVTSVELSTDNARFHPMEERGR